MHQPRGSNFESCESCAVRPGHRIPVEDYAAEKAGQSGRQSDASAVAPAPPVCLSDLNVLPLWGPVLNTDANAPLTLNQVRARKLT